MSRKFIVTADDYGVSPIIDEAVKQAVRMGIVTSVACFANKRDDNGNFTMDSVRELKNEFNDVEIGCHFTITSGDWMATTGSDLGRKGGKSPKFRRKAWQHPERAIKDDTLPVPVDELVDELTAQVEAFRQEGIKIEHFSDHMGILSYTKKGMEAMITVINNYNQAENLNSPMRNPIFISRVPNLNGTCLKKSTMSG